MKSNYYNTGKHCSRRGYVNRPTTAAAIALGFALLFFAATPCVGRTNYRGRAMTPRTSLRGARAEYGTSHTVRRLQIGDQTEGVTAPPTALETRATPTCTSISVPAVAGNLTGIYTHMGRYSHKRPVYTNQANGNHLFAQTASETTNNTTSSTSWYLTQSDTLFNFFLSIVSDVFEPIDMNGVQPWVRNNDAACSDVGTCFAWMLLNCETLATELFSTPAPSDATDSPSLLHSSAMGGNASEYSDSNGTEITSTPAASGEEAYYLAGHATSALGEFSASPTPSPTVPQDLIRATDTTTTSTSNSTFATDTSVTPAVSGCVILDVSEGGARTGVYLLKSPDYSNSLPGYVISGYRQDEVFSVQMSVCAPDWGVVNATWAAETGELPATASVRDVWLMYAAGLSLENSSGSGYGEGGCMVDVWLITGGGVLNLGEAEEVTFLAVSDAGDPSEAIRWAKFTPATTAERATLEDNSWIQVSCADSDGSDFDTTATPTPSPMLTPTPAYVPESAAVGDKPQGKGG